MRDSETKVPDIVVEAIISCPSANITNKSDNVSYRLTSDPYLKLFCMIIYLVFFERHFGTLYGIWYMVYGICVVFENL